MKVYLHSFGCRVNQYEGERVREGFLAGGSILVEDYRLADVCVLNTCSVTDEADKEARSVIRRIYKTNTTAQVIITGCYASRAGKELQAAFPEALIVSNEAKDTIPSLAGCSLGLSEAASGKSITSFFARTRAMVKVQDGCNMRCTYCIIPTTRPFIASRSPEEIFSEVEALLNNGYQEIVLCGIRLGRYWAKEGSGKWVDLIRLIERLAAFSGDFRIRLSSIEVTDLSDRFLKLYFETPKTVPYFHVPLQSGSDSVLKSMKRWYGTPFYAKRIEAVRNILGDEVAIFTDFMVGFPTETQEDFNNSFSFAQSMNFAGMHIFRYSPREGTPASKIEPRYCRKELEERLARTRFLDQALRRKYAGRFIGRELWALPESNRGGGFKARAENFLEVIIPEAYYPREGWQKLLIEELDGSQLKAARVGS